MSRLKENISSEYINAANRLNSRKSRRRIVAYVESYDDIFFWRTVLSGFEDDTRYFEVMLPSRHNLSKGKKVVLMNLLAKKVGENMIACVDADYDYLLQGCTPLSHDILSNPYVFHTYAYAIENLQCYAPSLHDVCVAVTLNDHAFFDFREFIRLYSEAIFPLFIWSIWHYRRQVYGEFTITDFNQVVVMGGFNLQDPMAAIRNIRRKVGTRVHQLQQRHPDAKESYLALKEELKALGVTPDTTYLYIQGHHLFDNIVVPVMKKVCDKLIRERESEIYHKAVHKVQMNNELSCYQHSKENIVSMLRKNVGYMFAPQFQQIRTDIERFLNDTGQMNKG